MWVIYKKSREPRAVSYEGSTWDKVKIRHLYQNQYWDKELAKILAMLLSKYNPVGFDIAEIK